MDGILLIDKPCDFTSFDVVAKMKGVLHTKKIGHAGTLDPMATGVLPLLVGKATRAMDILPCTDKQYIAGFKLGFTSNTLDVWGEVEPFCENFNVSKNDICDKLPSFTGKIEQIPPMYSAVSQNGVRLYKLARKGIEIERPKKQVTVHFLKLLEYDEHTSEGVLEISCSKGTYVRTIIDDLGKLLGCGAIMTSLKRTVASGFKIEDSFSIEQIIEMRNAGTLASHFISISKAFTAYKPVFVTAAQAKRFTNGGELSLDRVTLSSNDEIFCVYYGKVFLGLGNVAEGSLNVFRMFYGGGADFENN